MNSDELGTKGEARFEEICADAEVTCNKSTRDRTGWDFIVEFKFEINTLLDQRPAPHSAHFQVKTIKASSTKIKMLVSSAERLAKEPKPSFIYVFTVKPNNTFGLSYLLQILNEPLARILKRLREEEAKSGKKKKPINKQYMSFSISTMAPLDHTGAALRKAILDACPNMPASMNLKRKQLAELGFEPSAYQATSVFTLTSMSDLADGFLGLKPLKYSKLEMSQTRFGIKLPLMDPPPADGLMHIKPEPSDTCTISIAEDFLKPPAGLNADMFMTPSLLPKEASKFILQHSLFSISVTASEMRFEANKTAIETNAFTITDLLSLMRLQRAIFSGQGTLTIAPNKFPVISLPLKPTDEHDLLPIENTLKVLEQADRVLSLAIAEKPAFILDDIIGSHQAIQLIDGLLQGGWKPDSLIFRTDIPTGEMQEKHGDALYMNTAEIAGVIVAYCARAEMSPTKVGDQIEWISTSLKPVRIKRITDLHDDFDRFCEECRNLQNSKLVIKASYDRPSTD